MSIGGYFEIELQKGQFLHQNALLLNTGRNCLEYILRTRKYSKVYLPFYTCEVILEPFEKLNISYEYYKINEFFEPLNLPNLKSDEGVLYINYYGLKQGYIDKLARLYGTQLIVDNSQAYYASHIKGIDTFYSPRKFVGVPDGGVLYIDIPKNEKLQLSQDESWERMSALLKRADKGAEFGFNDFQISRKVLKNQPIKVMSNLTQRLLSNVDYEFCKDRRRENFQILDKFLRLTNKWHGVLDDSSVPMVYPYWTDDSSLRQRLIDNHIYVAQYWPNVLEWCKEGDLEYELAQNLLPLPIDQRYGEEEMKKIIGIICTSQK